MDCCYVGRNGNCGECHKLTYSRKKGFKEFEDFNTEQLEILFLRADIPFLTIDMSSIPNLICYHHHNLLMNKFKYKHRYCCDPFDIHKDVKVSGRKLISLNLAKQLISICQKSIKPGYKLCPRCQTQTSQSFKNCISSELEFTCSASDSTDNETMNLVKNASFSETAKESTNKSLAAIGESPIKLHSLTRRLRTSYCTKKIKTASKSMAESLAKAACINVQDIVCEDDVSTKLQEFECTQQDFINLMEELRNKFGFTESTTKEKIQILTLKPASWTTKQTMKYFNCSKYIVNKAATTKKQGGILAMPARKPRQGISDDTKTKVLSFYEDDEYSRMLPGVKDKISIGKHMYHQKRLLLTPIREIYAEFKLKYPDAQIGVSRFFELKPKWCVVPGSSGTHKVCVCTFHQNAVLLADACGISYRDMMAEIVCNINNKICMVHRCSDCPGEDALLKILNQKFEESNNDNIFFQQWECTDRAQIITISLPAEDFIEHVIRKISILTAHSFIAKCQSKYLKSRKESLQDNEAIVLLDFAENYQFVIQDEIQSFHWSKECCTVHPVVLYYVKDMQLTELSFCILSDDVIHDTSFVWKLQQQITYYIRNNIPHIQAIEYFSDGCAGQYKNFKNFLNLTHHGSDFNLRACWSFFATSHGKSPCDGIGGVVKRKLANVSLTRKASNPILSSQSAYDCCQKELNSIIFFHLSKLEVDQARILLNDRYLKGSTVIGTRSFHHFYPIDVGVVAFKRTSDDEIAAGSHCFYTVSPSYSLDELTVMNYIACKYDEQWWVGMIVDVNKEKNDLKVTFMHPHGPSKSFSWPTRDDTCWMPPTSVILKLSSPTTTNGRHYTIDNQAMDDIAKLFIS